MKRTCYYSKSTDDILPVKNAIIHRLDEKETGTLCGKDFKAWGRWVISGDIEVTCEKCRSRENK